MVFGDYLELLRGGGDPGCYLIFRVHEQLPELLDDIVLPACCRDAPWFLSRFWLSAPRVGSPLHFDLPENLYAQVSGRKRFLLFAPTQSRRLYRHPWYSGLPNFSRVDPEVPDYASYPRFRGARAHEAVLEPGEFLYIPSRWWHQARALDVSISANLWWARGPLHAAIRAAEVFARVRGLKL
jgi:hypothetical protein